MGWRYLTSMTPIEKPEDLAGKRVRVMYDTDILADYLHKMGAETIPIHYGDVARAFEANLVDCEENPYNNILNMKFYRFQKYITDMRYLFSTEGCYVSQQSWERLEKEQQDIISSVWKNVTDWIFKEQEIYNESCRDILVKEKGMRIVPVSVEDKERFKAMAAGIHAAFPYQDLLKRMKAAKKRLHNE